MGARLEEREMTATGRHGARFWRAEGGSVAIIFAAIIIPVIGIVSAAIDFGRAAKVRSTLNTATGAAAQAASALLGEDRTAVEREVKSLLQANLPDGLKELPHRITIAEDKTWIEVAMETKVPTTLMGVLGVSELEVEATGHARSVAASLAAPATAVLPAGAGAALGGQLKRSAGSRAGAIGGAPGLALPAAGLPQGVDKAAIEAAAQQLAEQLKELKAGSGKGGGLPPEAAAELQRAMRDLARGLR